MAVAILLGAGPALAQRADVEAGRRHTRAAFTALGDGDTLAYRDNLALAVASRPSHPGLIYRLAGAHAMTGDASRALEALERYSAMGLHTDIENDGAFAELADVARFRNVVELMKANAAPIGGSEEAFALSNPRFVPESVVHDRKTGAFYIGSVHMSMIVRRDARAVEHVFADREDGLWSILGMAIDPGRRHLWVTTSAIEQTRDLALEELGRSALLVFDLDTGALVRRLTPPGPGPHNLGDVVWAADGSAFTTDGRSGRLYRAASDGSGLEAVFDAPRLSSPQGLCFSTDGRKLYVADYTIGVLVLDVKSNELRVMPIAGDVTLVGIDGLACYGERLIAIQNGVSPQRILEITPSGESGLAGVRVLVQGHVAWDEPTLGTVVGDAYYYVANSHWNRFDREGQLPEDLDLTPPAVLRLDLAPPGMRSAGVPSDGR